MSSPLPVYDVVVVGGGIVGLATARELLARGARRVAVLEKEPAVARHQTGHNSGVIHAGLYYKPGSLKARLCLKGMRLAYEYCDAKGIPYKRNGKLVVAVSPTEVPRLEKLMQNAQSSGVEGLRYIEGAAEIRKVEPEATGLAAIHSPNTGIVDWARVAESFAEDVRLGGGDVLVGHEVTDITQRGTGGVALSVSTAGSTAATAQSVITADRVVTCCGTHSDRIAERCGGSRSPQILPVRGEYLHLPAGVLDIRGNIYPVPSPGVPFLGVHFTPLMDDSVIIGPSAVLALSREGYSALDISLRDVRSMARFAGFWRVAARHALPYGLTELVHNAVPALAVRRARQYVPALRAADVRRAGRERAGVRAQAVSAGGDLVDDFVFERTNRDRVVHARNAPSPGATSSLAIAEVVADYLDGKGDGAKLG